MSGLPRDVIQALADKGHTEWRIAAWATQPCIWVEGWPAPVKMKNADSIRFAAARLRATWDDRGEPAIPTSVNEWMDRAGPEFIEPNGTLTPPAYPMRERAPQWLYQLARRADTK